jgi:hypothetical protein
MISPNISRILCIVLVGLDEPGKQPACVSHNYSTFSRKGLAITLFNERRDRSSAPALLEMMKRCQLVRFIHLVFAHQLRTLIGDFAPVGKHRTFGTTGDARRSYAVWSQ